LESTKPFRRNQVKNTWMQKTFASRSRMVIFCWAQVRVQAHCPSNIHPPCWAQGGHGSQHVKRWTRTWGGPVKLCHVGSVSPRPWPRVIVFMVFMVIYSMYGITNATALILDARVMKTTDPTRSSTLFHTACQPSTDVSPWNLKDPGLWTCPHGQLSHVSVTVVTQLQAVTHVSDLTSPCLSRNASFVSNRSSYISNDIPPTPTNASVRRRVSYKRPNHVANNVAKDTCQQRTVTTLMGGRGYIQWRAAQMERHRTGHLAQINNSDAYLVIWDHKLWKP